MERVIGGLNESIRTLRRQVELLEHSRRTGLRVAEQEAAHREPNAILQSSNPQTRSTMSRLFVLAQAASTVDPNAIGVSITSLIGSLGAAGAAVAGFAGFFGF